MQEANQSQLPYHKDSDSRSNHIFDQGTQPVISQNIGKLQSSILPHDMPIGIFQFNRKGARMQNRAFPVLPGERGSCDVCTEISGEISTIKYWESLSREIAP